MKTYFVHYSKKFGYRVLPIKRLRLNMKNVMETFDSREDAQRYIALQISLNVR